MLEELVPLTRFRRCGNVCNWVKWMKLRIGVGEDMGMDKSGLCCGKISISVFIKDQSRKILVFIDLLIQ